VNRARRILVLAFFLTGTMLSQTSSPPDVKAQDPADELGKIRKNCPKHVIGCAEVLFTGQPLHIAVGTIAPQNGIGVGLAYVGHKTTENWRINWNADGVASSNASWRAGLYFKFVDSRVPDTGTQMGTQGAKQEPNELPEQPVITVYAQAISLNKLSYFGVGSNSTSTDRSFYGSTQTIVGASAVKPIFGRLHLGIYGEGNGRWIQVRASHDQDSPSIEQLFSEATAPGLTHQPFYLQLGAGLRARPSFLDDLVHLNYDFSYRPYIAVSDSHFSFQRLNVDLTHQFSLYRKSTRRLTPRDSNGPDDCIVDHTADHPHCPSVSTRDLEGSLGLRLFSSLAFTPSGGSVPFYLQPTLGGTDINGNASLPSYQDYRFRAPNVMLIRESFEHSIWKWPVGFAMMADQGKTAQTRGDLGSNHWKHSYATGLTLRAGGFPQIYLLFAWGGNEGTRTIFNINSSLLGGSYRPSLF
jgi:hypothetical protein